LALREHADGQSANNYWRLTRPETSRHLLGSQSQNVIPRFDASAVQLVRLPASGKLPLFVAREVPAPVMVDRAFVIEEQSPRA